VNAECLAIRLTLATASAAFKTFPDSPGWSLSGRSLPYTVAPG
jgi:hypothetical protein